MSRSEDYLNQLLKGAAPGDGAFDEETFGEDFLEDDFLNEEFLKEFEMDIEKLEEEINETGEEDVLSLFDDLDSILNGTKEEKEAGEPVAELETALEEETESVIGAIKVEDTSDVQMPVLEEGFSFADLFASDSQETTEQEPREDADVLRILEGLDGVDLELEENGASEDFINLDNFLEAGTAADGTEIVEFAVPDFALEEQIDDISEEKSKKKKSKDNGEKNGFMSKLGKVLFGEDDDEEEDTAKKNGKIEPIDINSGDFEIGMMGEGDLAFLSEFSGGDAASGKEEKDAKKEKKKKEKKEKKEKPKKEKKPKAPKPKKEKKPKKPKEPDNTPPLPKKPVILIFLMVASFVALVILGADLLGYSNQMTNAKNQYAKKNYSEAFAEISGLEMKADDLTLYNKYHVMAMVSVELEAYESLASQGFYDMALDSLVRTIGRAEKYREDAESYGCIQELNELEQEAEEILSQTFGVSREQALEFYSYRSKKEYSTAIANIIKEIGLEKVNK